MCFVHGDVVKFCPGVVANSDRRILVGKETGAISVTLGEVILHPGGALPLHMHEIEEVMTITSGVASATVGGETRVMRAGDVVYAPARTPHKLVTVGSEPMRFSFYFPGIDVVNILCE